MAANLVKSEVIRQARGLSTLSFTPNDDGLATVMETDVKSGRADYAPQIQNNQINDKRVLKNQNKFSSRNPKYQQQQQYVAGHTVGTSDPQVDSNTRVFDSTMSSMGTGRAQYLTSMDFEYFQAEIDKYKAQGQSAAYDDNGATRYGRSGPGDQERETEKSLKKFVDICQALLIQAVQMKDQVNQMAIQQQDYEIQLRLRTN